MLAVKNNVSIKQWMPPFGTPNTPVSLDTGERSAVYLSGLEQDLKGYHTNPTGTMGMPNIVAVDPFKIPTSNGPAIGPGMILTETLLNQKNSVTKDGTPFNPTIVQFASENSEFRQNRASVNAAAKQNGDNDHGGNTYSKATGLDETDPNFIGPRREDTTGEPILRRRKPQQDNREVQNLPKRTPFIGKADFANPYGNTVVTQAPPAFVGPRNRPPTRVQRQRQFVGTGGGAPLRQATIQQADFMDVDYGKGDVALITTGLEKAPSQIMPLPPTVPQELSIAQQAVIEANRRMMRRRGKQTIDDIVSERRVRRKAKADKKVKENLRAARRALRPVQQVDDTAPEMIEFNPSNPNIDRRALELFNQKIGARLARKRSSMPTSGNIRKISSRGSPRRISAPDPRPLLEDSDENNPLELTLFLRPAATTLRDLLTRGPELPRRAVEEIMMQEASFQGTFTEFKKLYTRQLRSDRAYHVRVLNRVLGRRQLDDVTDIR